MLRIICKYLNPKKYKEIGGQVNTTLLCILFDIGHYIERQIHFCQKNCM